MGIGEGEHLNLRAVWQRSKGTGFHCCIHLVLAMCLRPGCVRYREVCEGMEKGTQRIPVRPGGGDHDKQDSQRDSREGISHDRIVIVALNLTGALSIA